jgi:cytochrome oxidase Cu insertion factor (SCO1/SenC/PrrC family)
MILGLAALGVVVVAGIFWVRALQRVEIPANRGAFVAAAVLAAILGALALASGPGWLGGIAAGLAVLVSAFFLFTIAIGDQKLAEDAIQVGATIPAFTATDEHGQTFDSQSLAGHPVLIKFFRAHW